MNVARTARARAIVATLACTVALGLACSDAASPPAVATITIDPDSVNMFVGTSEQFSAALLDADGERITGRKVVWSTSNPSIVTVTQTGLVSAVAQGRATVTITSGGKSADAVVIADVLGFDFDITAVQFTQATQANDGSIPMVLGGNGAAVNVLVASNVTDPVNMELVLRLTTASGALLRADTGTISGTLTPSPTYLSPSVQFLLPASALVPGIRWQITRDPRRVVPDGNAANDVFPRLGPAPLAAVTVPPLKVRFVPVVLTAHGNSTGIVNQGNLGQYVETLQSVYPIGALQATVGTAFASGLSFGTPPLQGGSTNGFWIPLLGQLDLARLASADPTAHWVGVVLPPNEFDLTLSGGAAYVPGSGTSSADGTRTAVVTSEDWAADPTFARMTVAHELGHNFGRLHAPCTDPGQPAPANPDAAFPYSGGRIGVTGFDVRAWADRRSIAPIVKAPQLGDIMGYCTDAWISDYTYRGVLNFRGSTAAARSADAAVLATPLARVMIVHGTIDDTRGVSLEPVFSVTARPTPPSAGGRYRIEARAADGRVLFEREFSPRRIADAPGVGHFTIAIPVSAELESSVARIDVRGPTGTARLSRPATIATRALAPAALRKAAGGFVHVSCADAGARGILVREHATGLVLATAWGAEARVGAVTGARLEVVCSDGVQSTRSVVITQ